MFVILTLALIIGMCATGCESAKVVYLSPPVTVPEFPVPAEKDVSLSEGRVVLTLDYWTRIVEWKLDIDAVRESLEEK